MTYNVFGGTLSLTQSINHLITTRLNVLNGHLTSIFCSSHGFLLRLPYPPNF